jgi:hypothetical protein
MVTHICHSAMVGSMKQEDCGPGQPVQKVRLYLKNKQRSQALVAHAYNPSYSGGRDQEDCGSKPSQASSLQDPILKKPSQTKDWWDGSRCRP